jgi:hypothetical protein
MRLRPAAACATLALLAPLAAPALAAWSSSGIGSAAGAATTMPVGSAPTARASGTTVTVVWNGASMSNGVAVAGYIIKRYDSSGTQATVGASCNGTVTTPTCTESNVPAGTWTYTDTPVQQSWTGTESPASNSVTIAAGSPASAPAKPLHGSPTTTTPAPASTTSTTATTSAPASTTSTTTTTTPAPASTSGVPTARLKCSSAPSADAHVRPNLTSRDARAARRCRSGAATSDRTAREHGHEVLGPAADQDNATPLGCAELETWELRPASRRVQRLRDVFDHHHQLHRVGRRGLEALPEIEPAGVVVDGMDQHRAYADCL